MPYRPTQVGRIIGVSAQTVRDWALAYAPFFSPLARGEEGARLYSEEELATLRTIAALRASGMEPAEILRALHNHEIPPLVEAEVQVPPQLPLQTPQEASETNFALQLVQSSMTAQREATEARVVALEKQLRRQLWSHAVAFYLGVVTMGLIFYIMWWLVNEVAW